MKFQRLYIGDFGILRNQTLENIDSEIVVIGGLNRAGKSTLMQVLRYIGFGFPKGRSLPPPGNRYEVEADIALEDGGIYNLSLSGYGEPTLKRIAGKAEEALELKSIFNLDSFTYGRLFTITLDELSMNQDISRDDKKRLKSILLGAGFREMLLIPELERDFFSEGDKIGGKRGNVSVKQFKPYYNIIDEGQKLKEKGLSQVIEYGEAEEELDIEKTRLAKINRDIEELDSRVLQLDIIKNNFENYKRVKALEGLIRSTRGHSWEGGPSKFDLERLKTLRDKLTTEYERFQEKEIEWGLDGEIRKKIVGQKKEIEKAKNGISGLKERIRSQEQKRMEIEEKGRNIKETIIEANYLWEEGSFEQICLIRTDDIEYGNLRELTDKYNALDIKVAGQKEAVQRLEGELTAFKERGQKGSKDRKEKGPGRYLYFSLVFLALGILLFFINPLLGGIIGIGGFISLALSLTINALYRRTDMIEAMNTEREVKIKEAGLNAEENILRNMEEEKEILEKDLDGHRSKLRLPHDTSYKLLPDQFLKIRDIQREIKSFNSRRDEENELLVSLLEEYKSYQELLKGLWEKGSGEISDVYPTYKEWDDIFHSLGALGEGLDHALDLKIMEDKIDLLWDEIMELMIKYEIDKPEDEGLKKSLPKEPQNGLSQGNQTQNVFSQEDLSQGDLFQNGISHGDLFQNGISQGDLLQKGLSRRDFSLGKDSLRDSLRDSDHIIESFIQRGERAIDYKQNKASLDETINSILVSMSSDGIRRAFTSTDGEEEDLFTSFLSRCGAYSSRDEAEREYISLSRDLNIKEEELETTKRNIQRIENRLKELGAIENLNQGQREIDAGRADLKLLAEDYALNMTAAFLLREVGKNILDGIKDGLMNSAGNIFSKITAGQYQGILPSEPLLESDFQAILAGGTNPQTIDMLSRGTKEQLYLSVRLSRILEVKPCLPIIIDDSFANFDKLHLLKTMDILSEVSKTHQVFILTCHSGLVEGIEKLGHKAQYWRLEEGRLKESDSKGLKDYLGVSQAKSTAYK